MGVAFHVRTKGPKDQLSVVLTAMFIDSLGLRRPILQTDGEPAIKAWARAVSARAARSLRVRRSPRNSHSSS
eukprot:1906734-Alexandrium_andersonii.AAC.1